jgi:methionyl aminopeptidase
MIPRKSTREIELMRKAGRIVANAHALLESLIKPGVSLEYLDKQAEDYIRSQNAVPVFKGYGGFPASICASVNEEIVHGIPDKRKLKEGDILSVDIGVQYQHYIGDCANTYKVGEVSAEAEKLLQVCRECLFRAIEVALVGNKISDIARAVQEHADNHGYGIVRDYTGHGVGTSLHEEPQIPNYVDKSWLMHDRVLKPGYCLAIEPMLNIGTYKTKTVKKKNWDVVLSKDNSLSAHFEHTIAITKDGPDILTLSDQKLEQEQ